MIISHIHCTKSNRVKVYTTGAIIVTFQLYNRNTTNFFLNVWNIFYDKCPNFLLAWYSEIHTYTYVVHTYCISLFTNYKCPFLKLKLLLWSTNCLLIIPFCACQISISNVINNYIITNYHNYLAFEDDIRKYAHYC